VDFEEKRSENRNLFQSEGSTTETEQLPGALKLGQQSFQR